MKRFYSLSAIILLSTSCSSQNGDALLIDKYHIKKYSQPIICDSLDYYGVENVGYDTKDIPGLSKPHGIHYYYNFPSNNGVSKRRNMFEISIDNLKVGEIDIPFYVTIEEERVINKTYDVFLRFKSYRNYFADIYAKEYNARYDLKTNRDGVSELSLTVITSGHFYTYHSETFNFNDFTYSFKIVKYEKQLGDPYNVTSYLATYYFGTEKARIEGLKIGTYYLNNGSFSSQYDEDNSMYARCKKVNDIFKKYNDYAFIRKL